MTTSSPSSRPRLPPGRSSSAKLSQSAAALEGLAILGEYDGTKDIEPWLKAGDRAMLYAKEADDGSRSEAFVQLLRGEAREFADSLAKDLKWSELKTLLRLHFGKSRLQRVVEFVGTHQPRCMDLQTFIDTFVKRKHAAELYGQHDAPFLTAVFINGLFSDDLRRKLIEAGPQTPEAAFKLAHEHHTRDELTIFSGRRPRSTHGSRATEA